MQKFPADYTVLWPLPKPSKVGEYYAVCNVCKMHISNFHRDDCRQHVSDSLGVQKFGIQENVPRFLKRVINIPDKRHLGLVSGKESILKMAENKIIKLNFPNIGLNSDSSKYSVKIFLPKRNKKKKKTKKTKNFKK